MKSKWSNSNVLSHILVAVVVMASNLVIMGAHGDPLVPCYFIFGDSIVDNGNNNFLPTISKADYFPYGIDFPYGPTGRFTNGRTIADIITEYLGFNGFIQPFASANDLDLHSGVNYASASAGILGETGSITGDVMSLNAQIRNHQNTIMRMSWTFGRGYTRRHLNKCLYSVGMGSNDYLANYFQPDYYPSSKKYTLEQFTDLLIGEHTEQLKDLYVDGARKIVVFGLGKMGCIPLLINAAGRNSSDCVEAVNNAAQLFNSKLVPIIDQLNYIYSDAKFIYINNYKLGDDAHDMSGLEVETIGCCPAGSDGRCVPGRVPCEDRSRYMFWDAIHPSEALNTYYASRSISARFPDDSYPFDINTLISLRQDVAAAE